MEALEANDGRDDVLFPLPGASDSLCSVHNLLLLGVYAVYARSEYIPCPPEGGEGIKASHVQLFSPFPQECRHTHTPTSGKYIIIIIIFAVVTITPGQPHIS